MYYSSFILMVPVVLSLVPMVIKSGIRTKGMATYSWVVIGLCFFVCAHFFLIDVAGTIQGAELKMCGDGNIASTGLGGYCPWAIGNRTPFESFIAENFGGTFDGLFTLVIGVPLILILAFIGIFLVPRTIIGVLWSPFFIFLITVPLTLYFWMM